MRRKASDDAGGPPRSHGRGNSVFRVRDCRVIPGISLSEKVTGAMAMRKTLALLAAVAGTLVTALPASAVQFGTADGTNHPQVGLVVFYDSSGTPQRQCSGTLLSATVFLTGGHCASGMTSAQVWLSPGPITAASGYPFTGGDSLGTPYVHPRFDNFSAFPADYDLGIVVLSIPQPGPYASLAPVGTLDSLATATARMNATFDLVGYGVQDALPPTIVDQRTRYAGTAKLVDIQSALTAGYNVQLTAAPGTGGGYCFHDSGAPVFLAGTTTIVGVQSFVENNQCMGSEFAYRTDTADSMAFINEFLSP